MSSVYNPIYNYLNKTSDFQKKISPTFKFNGEYEVALVNCLLENTYDILRKDGTYDIKVKPCDWPLVSEHWIKTMASGEYPFVT